MDQVVFRCNAKANAANVLQLDFPEFKKSFARIPMKLR